MGYQSQIFGGQGQCCLIKEFDVNKDGKVSKEELITGVEKVIVGKPVEALPAWWRENINNIFNAIDTNKNGELSLEESIKALHNFNPAETEANITAAYKWAVQHGPSKGRYDANTLNYVIFLWASSPDDIPEVTTLTPYFRKL